MGAAGRGDRGGSPDGLSLRELCDVIYVLHLEQLERSVLAERQIAAVLAAAGAKDVVMPTYADALLEFEAALNAEPALRGGISSDDAELRRVLGVGRG